MEVSGHFLPQPLSPGVKSPLVPTG